MGQSERLYAGKHPIPPLHPMLWTVVGIAPGVGPTGRGAGPPSPVSRRTVPRNPHPACPPIRHSSPHPAGGGAVCGDTPHKPDPGHDGTEQGSLPVATPEMPSWKT